MLINYEQDELKKKTYEINVKKNKVKNFLKQLWNYISIHKYPNSL